MTGLEMLCTSLLETLADRQLQVKHQRAANREIASKLEILEDKLRKVDGGEILLHPSEVIMSDYKPGTVDDVIEDIDKVLEEQIKIRNPIVTGYANGTPNVHVGSETPDYEDLNKRFENLLDMIGTIDLQEVEVEKPVGINNGARHDVVHYNVSRPPDLLDCITQATLDLDLEEEVNITLAGMEIVPPPEMSQHPVMKDEQLPDHIQDMVDRALRDIK